VNDRQKKTGMQSCVYACFMTLQRPLKKMCIWWSVYESLGSIWCNSSITPNLLYVRICYLYMSAGGLTDPFVQVYGFSKANSVNYLKSVFVCVFVCVFASEGITVHCCDIERNIKADGHREICRLVESTSPQLLLTEVICLVKIDLYYATC